EFLDQRAIALNVAVLQIAKQAAALADELEQPAATVEIVGVVLKVARDVVDPLGQQRDLNFRRTGVALAPAKAFDDLDLAVCGECHVYRSPCVRYCFKIVVRAAPGGRRRGYAATLPHGRNPHSVPEKWASRKRGAPGVRRERASRPARAGESGDRRGRSVRPARRLRRPA